MDNLTEIQQKAVDGPINLADGHPRQKLTESQRRVIDRLPELHDDASIGSFEHLEHRAHRAFFDALGQRSAPVGQGVYSLYSSSVATMVVGAFLRQRRATLALLHPTFDNIHDLLADSARVVPLPEAAAAEADLSGLGLARGDCVFVTTPNNPTGWFLGPDRLERLATTCSERGLVLLLDTSFRGFDVRTQYDTYDILRRCGTDYVIIEDTGKLWPVSELKFGFMAVSEGLRPELSHLVSDVLLTVSPLVLRVIEELALDAAAGGFAELRRLIAANRATAAAVVADLDAVEIADRDARVSVCRLGFRTAEEAQRVRLRLQDVGVHVLPGQQFHWASPQDGARYLRFALARTPKILEEGMARLRSVVSMSITPERSLS